MELIRDAERITDQQPNQAAGHPLPALDTCCRHLVPPLLLNKQYGQGESRHGPIGVLKPHKCSQTTTSRSRNTKGAAKRLRLW